MSNTNDLLLSTPPLTKDERTFKKPLKSLLLVHKISKDYKTIKDIIEKNMVEAFSKMYFLKPKANEIDCESITLCYDSFLLVNTKYSIEYYKNKKYNIKLDENVKEAIIFDHSLKPKVINEKKHGILKGTKKEIVIESKERVTHETTKQLALNRKGRKINRQKLPSAPSEPEPVKFLKNYATNVRHPEGSMWEILNKNIINRPPDVAQVINENVEVTEQVLIYTPIYEARCRNLKSWEIKIIPVSGITGKILSL